MAARARVGFADGGPTRARVEMLEREGLAPNDANQRAQELKQLKRISTILAVTNAAFMLFIVVIVTLATISAMRIADSVRDIAETLSPQTVATMVGTMEDTLNSGFASAKNLEHLTGSSGDMGDYLLQAMNRSVLLVDTANQMASRMLNHPSIHMVLGDMPSEAP